MNKQIKTSLIAAVSVLGCTLFGQAAAPKAVVSTGKVMEKEDFINRRYTGLVESPAVVQIVPRVSGELLSVGFEDGEFVKKGQLLYQLDPTRYEAEVKGAQAKIDEAKALFNYAENNFDRGNTLYEKNATSKDTLESRQSVLDTTKAAMLAAEASMITAAQDLKDTKIVAPIDGLAGITKYTAGNYLTPSSGTLVTIIQVQPIRVSFSISTMEFLTNFSNFDKMQETARIRLRLADGSIYEEEGKIIFMNNEANKNTDSVRIYAEFANAKMNLISGSTVTVNLSKKEGSKVLAVSPGAVVHTANGPFVYLVQDGKVKMTPVVLGNASADLQFIQSGVNAGDVVVTGGTNKLRDGMEVETVEAK